MSLSAEEKIASLANLDFLADQKKEVLEALANLCQEIKLDPGQPVFEKGDMGGEVYVICRGSVQIHDGGHIFVELKEGNSFGEYSLLKSQLRSASATVKNRATLLKCSQQHIHQVEKLFDIEVVDAVLLTLRNIRSRMVDKDLLEEELTYQKQMVENQRVELELLNSTKDKFFSIIAHDLKNPFASLIGASDLLVKELDSMDKGQIITYLGIINRSARQGYNLLQNLLHWARVQTGSIPYNPAKVDLWDVVNDVVLLHTSSAQNKEIDISAKVDEDMIVWADLNMLNTVMRNLISNAIKFTHRKGTIVVSAHKKSDNVEVWVHDTGVGLTKSQQQNLFRIDAKQSGVGTENEKGTGLGLILCKEFIEKHNGEIWVESKPGKGSVFKFSLDSEKLA